MKGGPLITLSRGGVFTLQGGLRRIQFLKSPTGSRLDVADKKNEKQLVMCPISSDK